MATNEEIFKAGLKLSKQNELKQHTASANTAFDSFHFLWIKGRQKIETVDLDQLRVIASNLFTEIGAVKALAEEIEAL